MFPLPAEAHIDETDYTHEHAITPTETVVVPTETPTLTPTATPGPSATPTSSPPASSTSTNTPTPNTTIKPTIKQAANSQSNGFGGQGLVDEGKQVYTGLGFEDNEVLGVTESRDIDSVGDSDLLITLILLTAAVVLIVWTVYMVLVQKGIIKTAVKKDKQRVGITPQPVE